MRPGMFAIMLMASLPNTGATSFLRTIRVSLLRREAEADIPKTGKQDGLKYEILDSSSITSGSSDKCLCPMGKFWDYRTRSCITQYPWGYECGFWPETYWEVICADGLTCKDDAKAPLGNKTPYGFKSAEPRTCKRCEAEDECLTGEQRHAVNCKKEYTLSGEACATVKVFATMVQSGVSATATHTAEATATATASHTAKALISIATATDVVQTPPAPAQAKAGTVTAKVIRQDGVSATAEATATAKGTATREAVVTHEPDSPASATGKECVGLAEVLNILDLDGAGAASAPGSAPAGASAGGTGAGGGSKVGAILAEKVIDRGDYEAFMRGFSEALKMLQDQGLLDPETAAKAIAQAKAEEKARRKAEAAAMDNAQANAKDQAEEAAKKAAENAAMNSGGGAGPPPPAAPAEDTQARNDAGAKAEAQAAVDALSDLVAGPPGMGKQQMHGSPTKAPPPNAPRKMTQDDVAATKP